MGDATDLSRQFFLDAGSAKLDEVKAAIESKSVDVNVALGKRLETPLMSAAMGEFKFRDTEPEKVEVLCNIIKVLVEAGANLETPDKHGDTALIKCSAFGCYSTVKALIECGANVNVKGREDHTPLIWAARNGHYKTVSILLKPEVDGIAGAEVDALDSVHLYSALIYSAIMGHESNVQLLLDSNADVSRQGKDGFSALIWAARKGFDPSVKVLLDAGADVNAINTDNNNALHGAAGKGHDITIEYLLEAKADVNTMGKDNQTPVSHAARKGHMSTVKLLTGAGANADLKDSQDMTPAAHAFEKGFPEIGTLLSGEEPPLKPANGLKSVSIGEQLTALPNGDKKMPGHVFSGMLDKKKRKTPGYVARWYKLTSTGVLTEHKNVGMPASRSFKLKGKATSMIRSMSRSASKAANSGGATPRNRPRYPFEFKYETDSKREGAGSVILYTVDQDERNQWIQAINKSKTGAKPKLGSSQSFWRTGAPLLENQSYMADADVGVPRFAADEVITQMEHLVGEGSWGVRFIIDSDKVVISQVYDGQALKHGVMLGDVVTQVAGEPFDPPEETSEFEEFFSKFARPVRVTMERHGLVMEHTFVERPLGIECIVEGFAVRVLEVHEGFQAAKVGVKASDMITMINDKPFETPADADVFAKDVATMSLPIKMTVKTFKPSEAGELMGADTDRAAAQAAIEAAAKEAEEVAAAQEAEEAAAKEAEEAAAKAAEEARIAKETAVGYEVKLNEPLREDDLVMYSFTLTDRKTDEVIRVLCRYSAFNNFRSKVVDAFPRMTSVVFPPKTFFASAGRSPEVVSERATMLYGWLDKVMNIPEAKTNSDCVAFMKLGQANADQKLPVSE